MNVLKVHAVAAMVNGKAVSITLSSEVVGTRMYDLAVTVDFRGFRFYRHQDNAEVARILCREVYDHAADIDQLTAFEEAIELVRRPLA